MAPSATRYESNSEEGFHALAKQMLPHDGMSGIVSGNRTATAEGHLYNVANIGGEIKYICGQRPALSGTNIFPNGDLYLLYV
jgi:hypothetical protein